MRNPIYRPISSYSSIFSTYFFIFPTYSLHFFIFPTYSFTFLHIFDVLFFHIFDTFLHILHVFSHIFHILFLHIFLTIPHIPSYFRHISSWGHIIDFQQEISQKFCESLKSGGMGFGNTDFGVGVPGSGNFSKIFQVPKIWVRGAGFREI